MVWGGFGNDGVTPLVEISTRSNSQNYTDMLEENLLPHAGRIAGRNWWFQQDNAAIHSSKHTKAWFDEQGLRVLDWPARSPDLNPIENLWGIMTREVYAKGRQFRSVAELREAILRAWERIPLRTLRTLISSMKNRIFQVIYNKGAYTK